MAEPPGKPLPSIRSHMRQAGLGITLTLQLSTEARDKAEACPKSLRYQTAQVPCLPAGRLFRFP